ncbi:conserved hypothetical protein [Trichinella spiralis]|uniref:hypothetical protein n=1 Tax=Trichinella spiralis TaxID=6334 RepID=UPI0001EFC631|nr:conserved hypothetical protein [Trichinella spiralis]
MPMAMFQEVAAVANLVNEGFGDCPQVERFCYASDSRSIYIFGGIGFDENYKDQLYRFKIGSGWEELDQCGDFPLSRADACLGLNGNKLYLFGGTNSNLVLLNDFIEYDIGLKTWRRIAPAGGYLPPPLSKASMCNVELCLYLFGGETEQTENANMGREKETWNLWGEKAPGVGRAFHSAIAFAGHYILVYGGKDQEEWESSNFFIFDVAVILEFLIPYHSVSRDSKQAESKPSDCAANNDCIDL